MQNPTVDRLCFVQAKEFDYTTSQSCNFLILAILNAGCGQESETSLQWCRLTKENEFYQWEDVWHSDAVIALEWEGLIASTVFRDACGDDWLIICEETNPLKKQQYFTGEGSYQYPEAVEQLRQTYNEIRRETSSN